LETLTEYYQRRPHNQPKTLSLRNAGSGHFNVFKLNGKHSKGPYQRRDFYNVVLVLSTGKIYFANEVITIKKPALVITNPMIPYAWEADNEIQEAWFCIFTEAFIYNNEFKDTFINSPLFKRDGKHIIFLSPELQSIIEKSFEKMVIEIDSEYKFKFDLIRNHLYIIIHELVKDEQSNPQKSASHSILRTVSSFMELLERQFPITNPFHPLRLKTANDYSEHLGVHVNHLNRSVKKATGRTTSSYIAARIILEAQTLLQYSELTIAQIAYSLGFNEPSYFGSFYKKHTGEIPKLRRSPASL